MKVKGSFSININMILNYEVGELINLRSDIGDKDTISNIDLNTIIVRLKYFELINKFKAVQGQECWYGYAQ